MGDLSHIEAVVDEKIDPAELKKRADVYEKQITRGRADSKAAFEYAYCLVKSHTQHVKMGVQLFEELLQREDEGIEKRDYLYYLAMGFLKLKEFDKASNTVDAALRVEPSNQQFLDLKTLIAKRKQKEALKGAAIIGGTVMFGGAFLVGAIAVLSRVGRGDHK